MAPTICMTEDHVLNRSPSFCRRTFKLKRDGSVSSNNFETTLQNNSSGWRLKCPRDSSMPLSRVKKRDESQVLARRKELVNIIIRTLSLMRRNQLLQQRVDALREETQQFVKTVMEDVTKEDANSSTGSSLGSPLSDSISLVSSQDQEDQVLSESEDAIDEAYHSSNTAQSLDSNSSDDF